MSGGAKKAAWGCLVSMTVLPDVSLIDDVVWLGRGEVREQLKQNTPTRF
jgi:hypothetical protein